MDGDAIDREVPITIHRGGQTQSLSVHPIELPE
jgi:hypothetical protein